MNEIVINRIILAIFGVALLIKGVKEMKSEEATLIPSHLTIKANRDEQPLDYWLYIIAKFVMAALLLLLTFDFSFSN